MFQRMKRWARQLKKNLMTLYCVFKRKDVNWFIKVFIGLVVSYAFSPIDFIPDFIPILGYIDDLIIIPLGVLVAIKMVPHSILLECKLQAESMKHKPKSYIGASIMIMVWLVILVAVLHYLWLYFNK